MATLRSTLPDLYLSRLAFLEQVLFDEIDIEDGIVSSIFDVRDMGNKPFVRTTTVASFGSVPVKTEGANVVYDDLAQGYDKTYTADSMNSRSELPKRHWTMSKKRLSVI